MAEYKMLSKKEMDTISKETLVEKYNSTIETIWTLSKQLKEREHGYDVLFEDYETASGDLEFLGSQCNRLEEELKYMHDFISWMHLDGMYEDFRKNAREVQPEDGSFSYYKMGDGRKAQA